MRRRVEISITIFAKSRSLYRSQSCAARIAITKAHRSDISYLDVPLEDTDVGMHETCLSPFARGDGGSSSILRECSSETIISSSRTFVRVVARMMASSSNHRLGRFRTLPSIPTCRRILVSDFMRPTTQDNDTVTRMAVNPSGTASQLERTMAEIMRMLPRSRWPNCTAWFPRTYFGDISNVCHELSSCDGICSRYFGLPNYVMILLGEF